MITEKKQNNLGLELMAGVARVGRLAILLGVIPLGIIGLSLGLWFLRDAYLNQQTELSTLSLGLTSFGGVVILAGVLVILLLYLVEHRIDLRRRDQEHSSRGRDSIKRLVDWLPKESEES